MLCWGSKACLTGACLAPCSVVLVMYSETVCVCCIKESALGVVPGTLHVAGVLAF